MTAAPAAVQSTAIHELVIDSEVVLYLGEVTLIKSKSTEGAWWAIQDGRCSCPSFTYRGKCRHTAVASLASEYDRQSAAPGVSAWTPTPQAAAALARTPARVLLAMEE